MEIDAKRAREFIDFLIENANTALTDDLLKNPVFIALDGERQHREYTKTLGLIKDGCFFDGISVEEALVLLWAMVARSPQVAESIKLAWEKPEGAASDPES